MSLNILKATKQENVNGVGIEVKLEVDGEHKTECFAGYDEWMEETDGEPKFITRLKENYNRNKEETINISEEPKEKKTELIQYKNKVIL